MNKCIRTLFQWKWNIHVSSVLRYIRVFPFRAKPCHTKNQLTCFTPVALKHVKTLTYFATNTGSSVHTRLTAVAIYNCKEDQHTLYIVTQSLSRVCQIVQSIRSILEIVQSLALVHQDFHSPFLVSLCYDQGYLSVHIPFRYPYINITQTPLNGIKAYYGQDYLSDLYNNHCWVYHTIIYYWMIQWYRLVLIGIQYF